MTEEIAKRSIDWLRESGAGVLALMGGERTLVLSGPYKKGPAPPICPGPDVGLTRPKANR
jgi:hypothetical protein